MYLTVAMTKMEADVLGSPVDNEDRVHSLIPASTYSIADIFKKINPMHKLKRMLIEELDEYAKKNSISSSDLEVINMLTDAVKDMYEIDMLKDGYHKKYEREDYDDDRHHRGAIGAHLARASTDLLRLMI